MLFALCPRAATDAQLRLPAPTRCSQVLTIMPDFAKARKKRTGMFAQSRDKAGEGLLQMYTKFNTRLATALIDHEWIKVRRPSDMATAPPAPGTPLSHIAIGLSLLLRSLTRDTRTVSSRSTWRRRQA